MGSNVRFGVEGVIVECAVLALTTDSAFDSAREFGRERELVLLARLAKLARLPFFGVSLGVLGDFFGETGIRAG